MRATLLLLLLGLFASAAPRAHGQPIDTSIFSVLSLEASSRVAALGGSAVASPRSEPLGLYYNPALLDSTVHQRLGLTYVNHIAELQSGAVAFGRHYDRWGSFAVGIRFLSWGDIPRTDASGAEDGTFGAGEAVLSLAGSRPWTERVRYGAAVHLMRSGIDGDVTGALAADAGLLYHVPEQRLAIGLSAHHAGVTWSAIGTDGSKLPFDLRLAVSKRLRHLPLLLNLTAYDLADFSGDGDSVVQQIFYHLRLGGEFQFSDAFQVRFGYDHRRHDALKIKSRLDFAGFSVGTGIRVRGVTVDYARTSWSSLGALHRFSISTGL